MIDLLIKLYYFIKLTVATHTVHRQALHSDHVRALALTDKHYLHTRGHGASNVKMWRLLFGTVAIPPQGRTVYLSKLGEHWAHLVSPFCWTLPFAWNQTKLNATSPMPIAIPTPLMATTTTTASWYASPKRAPPPPTMAQRHTRSTTHDHSA